MTSEVALTGGSGFVGGHLLETLVGAGTRVRGIVRSAEAARIVEARGGRPVVADLFDHDALRDALWGTSMVYHVAGVNETCVRDSTTMDRVNIDGTRAVVAAAADAGVARIVYTSSAATIGEAPGIVGTEEIVHSGEFLSPYARSKYLAEQAAFDAARVSQIDLVSVNPSSVQGPGRAGGSARILLHALRSSKPLLYDTHVSIVDVADSSAAHIAAAQRGRAGERYLVSGATITVREAIGIAQGEAGVAVDPRWVSETTMRAAVRPLAGLVHVFKPGAGICPSLIDTLLHGHRFDASKSERQLGMVYTPIDETFARTIEWFRSESLID